MEDSVLKILSVMVVLFSISPHSLMAINPKVTFVIPYEVISLKKENGNALSKVRICLRQNLKKMDIEGKDPEYITSFGSMYRAETTVLQLKIDREVEKGVKDTGFLYGYAAIETLPIQIAFMDKTTKDIYADVSAYFVNMSSRSSKDSLVDVTKKWGGFGDQDHLTSVFLDKDPEQSQNPFKFLFLKDEPFSQDPLLHVTFLFLDIPKVLFLLRVMNFHDFLETVETLGFEGKAHLDLLADILKQLERKEKKGNLTLGGKEYTLSLMPFFGNNCVMFTDKSGTKQSRQLGTYLIDSLNRAVIREDQKKNLILFELDTVGDLYNLGRVSTTDTGDLLVEFVGCPFKLERNKQGRKFSV